MNVEHINAQIQSMFGVAGIRPTDNSEDTFWDTVEDVDKIHPSIGREIRLLVRKRELINNTFKR